MNRMSFLLVCFLLGILTSCAGPATNGSPAGPPDSAGLEPTPLPEQEAEPAAPGTSEKAVSSDTSGDPAPAVAQDQEGKLMESTHQPQENMAAAVAGAVVKVAEQTFLVETVQMDLL